MNCGTNSALPCCHLLDQTLPPPLHSLLRSELLETSLRVSRSSNQCQCTVHALHWQHCLALPCLSELFPRVYSQPKQVLFCPRQLCGEKQSCRRHLTELIPAILFRARCLCSQKNSLLDPSPRSLSWIASKPSDIRVVVYSS